MIFTARVINKVDFESAPPKAVRVAAYARVSTGTDEMKHSLAAQGDYYRKLIKEHPGWVCAGIYADEAVSGTKESRSEFDRLVADCESGRIDMIITKSISRFARNTVVLLDTVRRLKSIGVSVFFEEQNINTDSTGGELMLTLLASFAQEESRSASENQKWRIIRAFQNGELMNLRFMFGYNISKGKIDINAAEAEIVREIFDRAVGGDTLGSIARSLNGRGERCAHGGEWNVTRIREVLSNDKYTGNATLYKTFRNNHIEKRKCRNNGEIQKYYAENTHPAIIDMATFEKAEKVLNNMSESRKNRAPQSRSQFTGKIRCGNCGKNFKHVVNNGRSCWNCATYLKKGKAFCPAKRIPQRALDEAFAEIPMNSVEVITACGDNVLKVSFTDGSELRLKWKDYSRAESWTPEMKKKAKERMMGNAESNGHTGDAE